MSKSTDSTKKAPTRENDVKAVVASLKRVAKTKVRNGMARYGIPSGNALGVSVR